MLEPSSDQTLNLDCFNREKITKALLFETVIIIFHKSMVLHYYYVTMACVCNTDFYNHNDILLTMQ